ncbi:MAG: MacB family efflux pump subunit [bacterium]|nr:MacB family efflux pump subunit [bacterium]
MNTVDAPAPGPVFLELRGVCKQFQSGGEQVLVLDKVNLRINAGEMVAIIGPSGSGKSTLMNLIGCLDQPSSGSYHILGVNTSTMPPNELARLRREHFGFVFQRYHLITGLTAQENVEIPAIYTGEPGKSRRKRSRALLARLGLQERLHYKPGQLSGGQQQRVCIARALMNGGAIILADEPTGALDSATGLEVMRILRELHQAGHTIILVTHDAQVAAHAGRIIEIADGRILRDSGAQAQVRTGSAAPAIPYRQLQQNSILAWCARLGEGMRMAWTAMRTHRMRTLLTMLGIVIGIVSVALVNALGEGSKQQILADISALGTSTIDIYPGTGFGDRRADVTPGFTLEDAEALAALPFVDSVTPQTQFNTTVRRGNTEKNVTAHGVGEQFFRVHGYRFAAGAGFDTISTHQLAQEAVVDANTRKALFSPSENPIGQTIVLGTVPVRIIGVTSQRKGSFATNEGNVVWLPYTTVLARFSGNSTRLQSMGVRVADTAAMQDAENELSTLLLIRRGSKNFFTYNSDSIRATIEKTTLILQLMISSIAVISLLVGGIGVMNIMLVSVSERTPEIGIRMAVGARQGDILQQFIIEAMLVCLAGGLAGIALAMGIGLLITLFVQQFQLIFSVQAVSLAVLCSSLIGLIFGLWPARNAARLNPVDALANQ